MKRTRTSKTAKGATAPDAAVRSTHEQAIAAAKRIQELKLQYAAVEEQMKKIRAEAQRQWNIVNGAIPNFGRSQRAPVQNPRPVGDKLIISAGRAIASSVKKGNSFEQTKAAALRAAAIVGKKYGLASIPQDVISNIEGRAQKHFTGASA